MNEPCFLATRSQSPLDLGEFFMLHIISQLSFLLRSFSTLRYFNGCNGAGADCKKTTFCYIKKKFENY